MVIVRQILATKQQKPAKSLDDDADILKEF
jgi:hypothetical protein